MITKDMSVDSQMEAMNGGHIAKRGEKKGQYQWNCLALIGGDNWLISLPFICFFFLFLFLLLSPSEQTNMLSKSEREK
jgi:hypothetical protein